MWKQCMVHSIASFSPAKCRSTLINCPGHVSMTGNERTDLQAKMISQFAHSISEQRWREAWGIVWARADQIITALLAKRSGERKRLMLSSHRTRMIRVQPGQHGTILWIIIGTFLKDGAARVQVFQGVMMSSPTENETKNARSNVGDGTLTTDRKLRRAKDTESIQSQQWILSLRLTIAVTWTDKGPWLRTES